MGRQFQAQCKNCGERFEVREGGGRDFYLLHCDSCGKEKAIRMNEIMKNIPIGDKSLSLEEKIEKYAGNCEDGHYRIKAKARCPKCNSDEYGMSGDEKARIAFYD
ncbi:hypothetical protein [Heliorestis convoluta]|uniref:Uncharacterized protein n=1 Tax=Heliorestis convoluta TaxID=356322 RepID=A0A5Q2N9E7_9FIRM|nr:hypothetical protein [Heliorestis convoluta]QGG48890.1 hypothetical protein FTV88_2801 [Heliorestis convoluta]